MAPKSSPRESKIVLWRNTIHLFHETSRPPFVGPFRKLGFKYRVGPVLLNMDGEDRTPDIVASGTTGWVVLELGTGGASKITALDKYTSLDPRSLGQYPLNVHNRAPDVMSSRLSLVDDGPYAQLLVSASLQVLKADLVKNPELRQALLEVHGIDMRRLPTI